MTYNDYGSTRLQHVIQPLQESVSEQIHRFRTAGENIMDNVVILLMKRWCI
jgi:hypothetical protein